MPKDKPSGKIHAAQKSAETTQQKNQASPSSRPRPGMGRRGPGRGPGRHFAVPMAKPKDLRKTLVRIGGYLKQDVLLLIFVVITILLNTACSLLGPLVIGDTIDKYIIPGDFNGLIWASLTLLAIYGTNSLAAFVQGFLMASISQKTVARMRRDLFTKYQTLSLKFFDSHTHGELMSRLTNDIDTVSMVLSFGLTQFISGFITIIGTIVLMLAKSLVLTLIVLAIVPLMMLVTRLITKYTGKLFVEQQKTLGELNGKIEETISGQRVVKLFCREERVISEFEQSNQQLKKTALMAQVLSRIMGPSMNMLNNLGFALVAGIGGLLALNNVAGAITIGTISIFLNYSRQFTRPINELANQYNMVLSAAAGAERVFQILDHEPEPEDVPDAIDLKETGVKGHVEFRNVSFAYDDENLVLKNFNLKVKPGQTVALVGPTGAGKTTVINLLTRFYDVKEGSILIDGIDIRKIKRSSLRSSLGIVLQDTYLFNASVRENIRYGRLDATDEEVEQAAKIANAHGFITRLPQGYDTILIDDGGNLSHGQRQLLAIARAVLADPAILILDEATSSVDTRTEIYIQRAMLNLMKGRTSFVIAHRLSTIRDADIIVVIHNGQLIEQGTHEELLNKKGFYYNLYQSQFVRTKQIAEDEAGAKAAL